MQWFHARHGVLCGAPVRFDRVLKSRQQAWKQDEADSEKTAQPKIGAALKDGPMIVSGHCSSSSCLVCFRQPENQVFLYGDE
jgi:hypothetical protein